MHGLLLPLYNVLLIKLMHLHHHKLVLLLKN
jgi:hypothetical protein